MIQSLGTAYLVLSLNVPVRSRGLFSGNMVLVIERRDQIRCFEGGDEKSSEGQHMRGSLIASVTFMRGRSRGLRSPFPQFEMSSGVN